MSAKCLCLTQCKVPVDDCPEEHSAKLACKKIMSLTDDRDELKYQLAFAQQEIVHLQALTKKMAERIATLEAYLDEEEVMR